MTEQEKIKVAQKELNSHYDLYIKTKNLKEMLEILRNQMLGLKVFFNGEKVQGGRKSTDTLETCIDKCTKIEEKIQMNIWNMAQRQNDIVEKINRLDGISAQILFKIYIGRKQFERIAQECNYSCVQVKRKHKAALIKYYTLIKDDTP